MAALLNTTTTNAGRKEEKMKINDKYIVDVLISIISMSGATYHTPKDYCINYEPDEVRSITLKDLRKILKDVLGDETK